MIEVQIDYRGDDITAFSVKGHAGYAASGSDIYCAGISAVAQTTVLGLLHNLEQKPRYQIESGYLFCELPDQLSPRDREKAQAILSTLEAGLKAMEEVYQNYLRIKVRRY